MFALAIAGQAHSACPIVVVVVSVIVVDERSSWYIARF
jgi:hypothetical protein